MIEKVGEIYEGTVIRVYPRYAILLFDSGATGLLHISEISNNFVHNFTSLVAVGNIYKVKVLSLDESKDTMKVSVKQCSMEERHQNFKKKHINPSEVSFTSLEAHLPAWIQEENEKVY